MDNPLMRAIKAALFFSRGRESIKRHQAGWLTLKFRFDFSAHEGQLRENAATTKEK